MTLTVLKSQLGDVSPEDFARQVEFFRKSLEEHALLEGVPAPTAPNIIESAIQRQMQAQGPDVFVADYEIVDDTPPPPSEAEVAASEKARKIAEIRQWEQDKIAAIIPPERQRLANLDYARAAKVPTSERTPEQADIVRKHDEAMNAIEDIQYEAAQREAELV